MTTYTAYQPPTVWVAVECATWGERVVGVYATAQAAHDALEQRRYGDEVYEVRSHEVRR